MTATTGANIRPAASLLLLRDGPRGTEVLLMRRPERGDNDFRSGMCVFPGGVIDRADAQAHALCFGLDDATASARLGLPQGGLDYFIAALRESFEEVGLLFACQPDGQPIDMAAHAATLSEWRGRLHRGEAGVAQMCQALAWRLDLRDMAYFAHWLTPVIRPKRFDTRFFVRVAPPGQQAMPDFGEALELLWLTPEEALDPARGLKLLNVTQKVLHSIAGWTSARAGFEQALALRGVRRIFPRMALGLDGPRFVIDGDAAYDEVTRLDPHGRGDVKCVLTPGDATQLSARLFRVTGQTHHAYMVGDSPGSTCAVVDPDADDPVQLQALRDLARGPVRLLLFTHAVEAPQFAALQHHWPFAHCPPPSDLRPGRRLQVGAGCTLRLLRLGESQGLLLEEDRTLLSGQATLPDCQALIGESIDWLAPKYGFLHRHPAR